MSFFKPTEDEVKNANSGGNPVFKHGDEVHFLVSGVDTKEKDGSEMIIIALEVLNTDQKGMKQKIFIRDNQAGWGIWMSMLSTFLTPEQIAVGIQPSAPIGRSMKATAKISAREGKEYINFYEFSALDTTPSIGGGADLEVSPSDIPF